MCSTHDHDGACGISRRQALTGVATGAVASAMLVAGNALAQTTNDAYAPPAAPALPPSDMVLRKGQVALVVTDPQIDFLSPDGVTWGVVGESVTEHGVVANIGRLFRAAKQNGLTVAVSPHYYYPTDHGWKFEGALEKLMHSIGMFDRKGPLTLDGFAGSGADFLGEYGEFIHDGKTIITSPHKVYGPESNDLALQLRKNGVSQVILSGMSANLCVESHLRELLEQGFEVAVVRDATAAAKLPEGDGYLAALTNFRFVANALWSTDEAVSLISSL
jgi:nicotinamidase-related amidase